MCGLLFQLGLSQADSVFIVDTAVADAFLVAGTPSNTPPCNAGCADLNFGGAGTLAIAPASSPKGQFDSVVQWNTAGAVTQFNNALGVGNWQITNIALNLASNFGDANEQPNNAIFNTIHTGQFNVQWISNNSWIEGTGSGMGTPPGNPPSVTFGNRNTTIFTNTTTTAPVGTFTYIPPGDNIYRSYSLALDPNLTNDVLAGSLTSLYFTAADDQIGYLFNAKSFAQNHPQFIITAAPVPVPAAMWLFGSGVVGLAGIARRNMTRTAA